MENLDEKLRELAASSESIISLLLSNGGIESTDKYKRNNDYEVLETFMFGERFATLIECKCITKFALNMYENKDTHAKFLKYKVHSLIPTAEGLRDFDLFFNVGYTTKTLFETVSQKIDLKDLSVDLVKNLKITVTRRKSDNKVYRNADLLSLSKL